MHFIANTSMPRRIKIKTAEQEVFNIHFSHKNKIIAEMKTLEEMSQTTQAWPIK